MWCRTNDGTRQFCLDDREPESNISFQATVLPFSPEIRNEIYSLLFVKPYVIRALCDTEQEPYEPFPDYTVTDENAEFECDANLVSEAIPLLRVSKQTQMEAAPFLYGPPNSFWLYSTKNEHIEEWLLRIGTRNRLLVASLKLDWSYGVRYFARTFNISGLIDNIRGTPREEIPFYDHIIMTLRSFQDRTVKCIKDCLDLLAIRHFLAYLCLDIPGFNAGELDVGANDENHRRDFFFLYETFYTFSLSEAVAPLGRVRKLRIGQVYELENVELMAKTMGVVELEVFGNSYPDWDDIHQDWEELGWSVDLSKMEARKTLEFSTG